LLSASSVLNALVLAVKGSLRRQTASAPARSSLLRVESEHAFRKKKSEYVVHPFKAGH